MQTFLFTDIESSTRLWEERPTEMATALARHDSILTEAVDEARGSVLKNTGDGVVAVFGAVDDALAASIAAQKALITEPWGAAGPLRVRMGVHTGESESRDGDFFGPVMNRTARIMAAGHGGQVLLSSVAAALGEAGLPDGAALRDLGTHRLKDLTHPEHLFQLIHTDLASEFPALLTLDTRPHNLPLQATEFLGRSDELATIAVMLESPSTRLLTITGPGGAGKTRLGLQVAAEELDRFRDGVFFVDLSAERDPDAAFEAIVRALALPVSGGGEPLQVLKTRLRDLQMLLVLDNFEQVTAAATGVSELLQHAPELKVIVTSRETLRVRAEHVYPVPPLSLPHPDDPTASIAESEAVQLFAERARAVRPDFVLTDETAPIVAEICLRLDGLPLAIELAAARLNVFTPSDLRERLRDRLDVLGAGGRDLPDRQRTLWGAIGWSYELLADDERDLFELISVFSGADLAALESVAAALGSRDIVDCLASLVDKSLIRAEEEGTSRRFTMLLMIKEFAAERLADRPDHDEAVRRAHADYYSGFAHTLRDRLHSAERESALDDLDADIGNLRTGWRFWVDRAELDQLFRLIDGLWALHEAKGWYRAAIELATDALGVLVSAERTPERADEELALRTSLARALMAVRGYGVEVEEAFRTVLEMSEETGTATQRFPVLRALASYYQNIADFDRGREMGRRLVELAEREGDESLRIEADYVLGLATAFSGDLEHGLPLLDRVIELYDPVAHSASRFRLGPNPAVGVRVASGLLLWQCGALEEGVARVRAALDVAREIDHPYSVAYALYHNGFLALNRYRFEECRDLAEELAGISEANEYLLWGTLATVLEGVSLTALGSPEEGLAMTETGITLYQGLTAPPVFWPLILTLRATVHAFAGRPDRAIELIDEAIDTAGDDQRAVPHLVFRGDFLLMMPEPDVAAASAAYQTALRDAEAGGLHLIGLQAATRLVTLRRQLGEEPDGSAELAAIYDGFTEGFDEHDLVMARQVLGY
jgi:predicted ATPase/class 3 adenylate cyclase